MSRTPLAQPLEQALRAPARSAFRGSLAALPTPFQGGELDETALRCLIERHLAAGTEGLVVAGTTGEAATLEAAERRRVLELCLALADGRVPVLAGVGTNSTRSTCHLAADAARAGADGLLVVTPYYNRPNRSGLLRHFEEVAAVSGAPLVLYNVPARTGCDLGPGLVAEIARRCPQVVAIKEASNSLARLAELRALGLVDVLVGDDGLIAAGVRAGAVGAVGVSANLIPAAVRAIVDRAAAGESAPLPGSAGELEEQTLADLARALFVESNPVPLKAALAILGWARAEVRPPLGPLEPRREAPLREALGRAGLL